ncbi:hypothetical protein A6E13_20005 [Aliivibrio fischeri]|uniref:DUF4238 domain-containing protein n=1 Tax=Aliivibrio fischeri TaxID=668 RepID=UPI00080E91CE|nr:DUF4238 domain-containing protein [Aliivibrio fischeri]OCH26234.1 hypothetical protein A6E13_20005 [Aliivibrio fischeri]
MSNKIETPPFSLRKTNIKQHYVPQFYLKNFTNDNQVIFVFDTNKENKYQASTKSQCFEKYCYDIRPDILNQFSSETDNYEEIIDDKIRILNEQVSSMLFMHLNNKIKVKEYPNFNDDELYNFILLQIIRTPDYKKRLEHIVDAFLLRTKINNIEHEQYLNIVHNLFLYGVIESLYDLNFKLNQDYHDIFDCFIEETINIKKQLEKSGILFLSNESKEKFITSTTPINVRWKPDLFAFYKATIVDLKENRPVIDIGNNIEFLTINLAISSHVSIFIFDKEFNQNLNKMDRKIGVINDRNSDLALNLNYSIFLNNTDKVFSEINDFDKFIDMRNKRKNPTLIFHFN